MGVSAFMKVKVDATRVLVVLVCLSYIPKYSAVLSVHITLHVCMLPQFALFGKLSSAFS